MKVNIWFWIPVWARPQLCEASGRIPCEIVLEITDNSYAPGSGFLKRKIWYTCINANIILTRVKLFKVGFQGLFCWTVDKIPIFPDSRALPYHVLPYFVLEWLLSLSHWLKSPGGGGETKWRGGLQGGSRVGVYLDVIHPGLHRWGSSDLQQNGGLQCRLLILSHSIRLLKIIITCLLKYKYKWRNITRHRVLNNTVLKKNNRIHFPLKTNASSLFVQGSWIQNYL